MPLPPSTSKEEMQLQLDGTGAIGDERIIQSDIFLTDAFDQGTVIFTREQLEATGGPITIDGFNNDDSYRRSRHLIRTARPSDFDAASGGSTENNLRDNSLARQLAEREDQPATIRLIRRRSPEELAELTAVEHRVPWVNLIPPNTKFFLEQVNETREEKVQVIDTFGEWVAFFFGRKPEIYSYSGTLLNAKNHDWKNEFQDNYENFLRGSQAVKHRATMILQYDSVMVEGYMMNCAISQSALADKSVPFQFTLLVINRSSLNPQLMTKMRFERSGQSADEQMLFDSLQASLDLTKTGATEDLETFILMREYFSGSYKPAADTTTIRGTSAESGASVQPGASAGTTNEARTSAAPSFGQSNALASSGVSITHRIPPAL